MSEGYWTHDGFWAMELVPEEIRERLPGIKATEGEEDPEVVAKFFTPDSSFTWYVLEFDGEDTFFGYVRSHMASELGYFSLAELREARGGLGCPIERDAFFQPCPLSAVKGR